MRTLLVAALALLPLLAGCSGAKDGPADPLAATATTGILKGIVVDEAIRPLRGVNVTVPLSDGTMLNSTTADDGAGHAIPRENRVPPAGPSQVQRGSGLGNRREPEPRVHCHDVPPRRVGAFVTWRRGSQRSP